MAVFVLPDTRDILKYHTRWNDQALTPYIDDLLDLWAENDVHGVLDVCMQGPMMTRFGIRPDDMKSASKIMKLEPLYRYIFLRKDIQVYRSEGRVYIDVPWQRDPVWLGDLLTSREFQSSQGLPVAIGMNIYRECVIHELTEIPHLLIGGNPSSGLDEFLEGVLLSLLVKRTPDEIELFLCSSGNLGFDNYAELPYCHVFSSVRSTMAMLSEMSREIDLRTNLLVNARCRNIFQYNERGGNLRHRIVLITEYQRLFNSNKQAAMAYILRMTEFAGPCGIHLILASSNPACLRGLSESAGTALMFITHDLGIVAETCDDVAIMYAGQIVEYGSLAHIFDNPLHPYTKGLFASIPSLDKDVDRLTPIKGLMPDPSNLPEYCKFCDRCDQACAGCSEKEPEYIEAEPGHFVRCLLVKEAM